MSGGPFIHLRSGRHFHILTPGQDEIHITDIAWALSHLNRFTGHTRIPYSVLDHSIRVAELVPDDLKLTALSLARLIPFIGERKSDKAPSVSVSLGLWRPSDHQPLYTC